MTGPAPYVDGAGGLDLNALLRRIARSWVIIAVTMTCFLAATVVYLRGAHYKYAVGYTVTPVQGASDSLSSTLGKVGGVAALAGISLPQGGDATYRLYLEAVRSRDVADRLAADAEVMHMIFAPEWDERTQRWHEPGGFVHAAAAATAAFFNVPGLLWQPPAGARLDAFLQKEVVVSQDPKSVTAMIVINSTDPVFGRTFLMKLHAATDGLLRERAIVRTDAYINYLTLKLNTVILAEHRAALSQSLGEQERVRMLASSPRSFAAEVFQTPAASLVPVTPRPLLYCGISLVAGLLAGLCGVVIWIYAVEGRRIRDRAERAQ